ncbi:MAG: nickel-dependent lactate racemase [Sphaerochaeta sp.]
MNIKFPYGKSSLDVNIDDRRLQSVLYSSMHNYKPQYSEDEIVEESIQNPIGTKKLSDLAINKNKVILIASDHTRPVPSKIIVPKMLREIRKGNPNADITILIATGCHRSTVKEELISKFGDEIYNNEKIIIHDCDLSETVNIGTLPSGGECFINKLVIDADLVVSEGFIEPHFFAGYSGARKSILPGVASRSTVLYNHNSSFIADSKSRTGILIDNPIHRDMVWAANKAKLAFIVNVVIDSDKKVIFSIAGDQEKAHKRGCEFLSSLCQIRTEPADIVISTNGGFPLDQNIYQAVKGMTAAESCVKQDGVIIMIAKSNDGIGGDKFYHQLADEKDINKTMELFLSRDKNETEADQWQTQIFLRILQKAKVIYISEVEDKIISDMHMIPASNLDEALKKAEKLLNNPKSSIIAIPDGVSLIVSQ